MGYEKKYVIADVSLNYSTITISREYRISIEEYFESFETLEAAEAHLEKSFKEGSITWSVAIIPIYILKK